MGQKAIFVKKTRGGLLYIRPGLGTQQRLIRRDSAQTLLYAFLTQKVTLSSTFVLTNGTSFTSFTNLV